MALRYGSPSALRVGSNPHALGFEELVAQPLRALSQHKVRTPSLLARLRPTRWFARDAAVRALSDGFVRQVPWWSTPLRDRGADGPVIVLGATEVGYGVDWVFMDPNAPRGHTGASPTDAPGRRGTQRPGGVPA